MEPKESPFACDAFISYSHEDLALAERLSRRIRSYRAPRKVKLPRRTLRVFRDVERLTASPDLSKALAERLGAAEHLVLVASPSAARSHYVDQEVDTFIKVKGCETVCVVLCRGDPTTSFPPSFQKTVQEPLFIDLRSVRSGLLGLARFRTETLRLLAALFKVDYSELRREDEKRRRRQRSGFILATIALALLLGSIFLIRSVSPHTWTSVELPDRYRGSPLLPVQEYAVSVVNPAIRLYRVHDANYASQRPKHPVGLIARSPSLNSTAFRQSAMTHLKNAKRLDFGREPLAVLRFSIQGPDAGVLGTGEMHIHAFLGESDGQLRFLRGLQFNPVASGSAAIVLPLSSTLKDDDPFNIDAWASQPLSKKLLLPVGGLLRGTIHNRLDGKDTPAEYEIIDYEETFMEGNDGMWFETAVISDDPSLEIEFGGEKSHLRDIDTEDELWEEVSGSADWVVYRSPKVQRYPQFRVRPESSEPRAASGSVMLDQPLRKVLERTLAAESDLDHTVTIASRETMGRDVAVVTIVSTLWDDFAGQPASTTTRHLIRNGTDGEWIPFSLNVPYEDIEIVDIHVLDRSGRILLLLTDRDGFHRSLDGGQTWINFNHGEPRLLHGRNVKPICVGTEATIYALVDNYGENTNSGRNPLFQYRKRGTIQRLKVAIIERLGGKPDDRISRGK